jgi:integrase
MSNPNGWSVPEGQRLDHFTDDELRRLFAAIAREPKEVHRRRDRAMFSTILHFGLRAAEVGLLKVEDFNDTDPQAPQLKVTRVKERHQYRKDEAGVKVRVDRPRMTRVYEVPPDLAVTLRAWLKVRGQVKGADKTEALFCTSHERPISTATLYSLTQQYAERAGIKRDRLLGPHMFRHTCAAKLAKAGHSAYDIQYQLGHANVLSGQAYVNRFGTEVRELSHKIAKALEF